MSNIIVSGLTAAGKTTHSRIIAERFGLRYIGGSDIALHRAGIKATDIPPDFWITSEGVSLLHDVGDEIDGVLLDLEQDEIATVFDCFYMPWLHRRDALCVWIESSLESRLVKATVSHRGLGRFHGRELEKRIIRKDDDAREMLKRISGADMYKDRSPFHHVFDLSSLIISPTQEASAHSIAAADAMLSPIIYTYLTQVRDESRKAIGPL
jgi:CMP/dCMP kinase